MGSPAGPRFKAGTLDSLLGSGSDTTLWCQSDVFNAELFLSRVFFSLVEMIRNVSENRTTTYEVLWVYTRYCMYERTFVPKQSGAVLNRLYVVRLKCQRQQLHTW